MPGTHMAANNASGTLVSVVCVWHTYIHVHTIPKHIKKDRELVPSFLKVEVPQLCHVCGGSSLQGREIPG